MTDKTKRMLKIETYWDDYSAEAEFIEQDNRYWCVRLKGFFADFELAEIVKALKSANRAGRL